MPDVVITVTEVLQTVITPDTDTPVAVTAVSEQVKLTITSGTPGPTGADGDPGYVIFQGVLAGEETLLDTVDWFNGKWDLIVRNGSLFYMSTITAVSDGTSEPSWVEESIVYGGAGVIVRCEVAGNTMRVLAGGTGTYQIRRHVFEPMGPPPELITITDVAPDPMYLGEDPPVILTGFGFNLWETSPGIEIWLRDGFLENGPVSFTVDSDTQIVIPSGSVPGFEAMAGALTACYFELRSVNYDDVASPTFPIWNPTVATIFSVLPGSTTDPAQAFDIFGFKLDEVIQVTVEDDNTLPAYFSVPFTIISPTQIAVDPGAVQTLIDNGSLVPFQFRFRIWDLGGPTDYSEYIDVAAPPPPNALADGQYLSPGPGGDQEVVSVGIYDLRVNVSAIPTEGAITEIPLVVAVPTTEFSFAVWARKVNPASASGDFVTCAIDGAWNFRMYTGAIETVDAWLNTDQTEDPGISWWNDDQWHMFVFTKNGGAPGDPASLYRDGVLVATTFGGAAAPLSNPTPSLFVGGVPVFANLIGTGAAWTRVLDATEVADLWTQTTFPPV
jgi:hypothetical protein